ncbi:MAG: nucleoside deaminase [Bacteriovoracaceae bacterium]|nr:nucleoside deaminase [Bacteriovoracaceae bacterium]
MSKLAEKIPDHLWHMQTALKEAQKAYKNDEVPIGAVLVGPNGDVLSAQYNQKEHHHNPTGHAEILCIQEAAAKLGNWRLSDCTLYVTLEPCPMCLSAIQQARLKSLVFGAYDGKGGSISLGYNLHNDQRLNHQFEVLGGIAHFECSQILSQFFREKRKFYQKTT